MPPAYDLFHHRQTHGDRQAGLCIAHVQLSVVRLRHQAAQVQAQPDATSGALACGVRAVERLGQVRQVLGLYAAPMVTHLQL